MEKMEFLNVLRIHIQGVDDIAFVNDTMNYYENYIETEIRKGKSEEEVINKLGDPRLIAKSILASRSVESETEGYNESMGDEGTPFVDDKRLHFTTKKGRVVKIPLALLKWGGLAVGITVIVLFAMLALRVIGFFMPIICLILLVSIVINFFRNMY
ncbi:MAG: DUF1700 domain-containing protein [Lachnospiraceae bacterium]|nr:DUF1700 domain-containing protein [Lachnospiraceae bacterium]